MNADEVNYCVRCGTPVIRQERVGRLRPVCPACDWIFFPDPRVAVAVVVRKNSDVLLVQRANPPRKGYWTLPGGFMDAGEDPFRAAERECLEETGLVVRATELLGMVARPENSTGAHLVLYFHGEYQQGDLIAADDAESARYFPLDRLPPLAFEIPAAILHFKPH
jgi:ADP-ribose pyrophosphatase YjhB (NUDIX family)